MDGLFNFMEKPELKMDDLGGKPPIFGNTHMFLEDVFQPASKSQASRKSKLLNASIWIRSFLFVAILLSY